MAVPRRRWRPLRLGRRLTAASPTRPTASAAALPTLLVHASAVAVVGLLLVSAGQPLVAEDTWWHLSMGAAYAADGPWLGADPLLHTAAGPPAPAAWLFDVGLHAALRVAGFQGLRVAHVLLVAGALLLGWTSLRRASGLAVYASLGTALFAALSAYRMFQLRPHLLSAIAALLLVRWLVLDGAKPSWPRVAGGAMLVGLWANLHGAFPLGPLLLAAAVAGLAAASLFDRARRSGDRARAGRLAAALGLALLASLANPGGWEAHGLYFAAGGDTPELGLVADEWARFAPFTLPVPRLPPSPLVWSLTWALLLLTPIAWLGARRPADASDAAAPRRVDPALLGVAAVSLVAMLAAVRLSWLGIFPLLAIGQCLRARRGDGAGARTASAWTAAAVGLLTIPAFWFLGAWPMIGGGVRAATYTRPYPAAKFYAHAVWFLRDAELAGNLYNDYSDGNFLGYWLAPRLRVYVNGSLNVPRQVMTDGQLIRRAGFASDATLAELLDRQRVDVFFGSGTPVVSSPHRPEINTTGHLEAVAGWLPVFRNLRSAVYLRDDESNRDNLARVAAWYARAGVPFDGSTGFRVGRAIAAAPGWAFEHGVIPAQWGDLQTAARRAGPPGRAAREELAALYATLGLYAAAEAIDRELLAVEPRSLAASRRLLWSLVKQRRIAESLAAADSLEAIAPADDWLSRQLVVVARRHAVLPDGDARALAAGLPVLTASQLRPLFAGFRGPDARTPR